MLSSFRVNPTLFKQNAGLFMIWGILLMLVGMLAIGADVFTTIVTIVFIGVAITIGGAVVIFDAFTFWRRSMSGFILHLLMGILYVAVGYILIKNPVEGSISLTLVLGIFYLVLGAFRTVFALSARTPHWGWALFNGLVSLLLGGLILASWPASSLYIIGLFVGIDLIFSGWAYFMLALSVRNA
jgi:uncharacterized membrane protein HdeD (DUF308 family)